jgi:OOP family OmpA-OmpF porin
MKQKHLIKSLPLLAITALAATSQSALADSGYALAPDGSNVRDSFGNCVKTFSWTKDDWTEACGKPVAKPKPKPKPVAKPEPKPTPPPKPQPVIETVTLDGMTFFAFDKADLDAKSQAALDSIIDQLRTFATVKSITITGHTDSIGSRAYNQKLSEKRAQSVADFLIGKGVNPALLSTVGAGEDQPVADNSTAEGRAQNRRAVVDILGTKTR